MAARFCPQCSNEVSSTAKFCPNCAAPLSAGSPPPSVTTHPLDTAVRKSRSLLLPAAIAAVVVLAAAVAVLVSSHRSASLLVSPPPSAITAPAITNAPAQAPLTAPPLTNAPAQAPITGPAVTDAPDKPAPSLPPDVAAYLNFLQGIEQKRVAMNSDISGAESALMPIAQGLSSQGSQDDDSDKPDAQNGQNTQKQGFSQVNQGLGGYQLKWQALMREFRSTPPPPACTLLANHYWTFLSDYSSILSQAQLGVIKHSDNPQDTSNMVDALKLEQAAAKVNPDGNQADTALSELCARYGVAKPFVINPEGAAPSLLGH